MCSPSLADVKASSALSQSGTLSCDFSGVVVKNTLIKMVCDSYSLFDGGSYM